MPPQAQALWSSMVPNPYAGGCAYATVHSLSRMFPCVIAGALHWINEPSKSNGWQGMLTSRVGSNS